MPLMNAVQRNEYLRAWRKRQTYLCACGTPTLTRGARCYACRWGKDKAVAARLDMPWHLDAQSQEFVETHLSGATLEEIGEELGLTRERVRQLEESALRKLLARMPIAGVTAERVAEMLAGKAGV